MKIKCGIIGLPNVGKSTLFNLLTNSKIKNKNFPFCTIIPNIKNLNIKNNKIYKIAKIEKVNKIKLPKITYIDIAGLIKGSSKGIGLGNKFLNDIKNTNILLHVIRIFDDKKIININNNINTIRDINIIEKEIKLYDLMNLKKEKIKNKKYNNIIKYYIKYIKKNIFFKKNKFTKNEKKYIKKINLLTLKKKIYILNIKNKLKEKIIIKNTIKYIKKKKNNKLIIINIKKLYKNKKIIYNKYIDYIKNKIKNYILKLLKLIKFYTINKKEVRMWILKKNNNNILKGAKEIHSDFYKKFIKAKVINYKNFIKNKGLKKSQKIGKIKIKGKKYKIKNNDIIYFLINKNK